MLHHHFTCVRTVSPTAGLDRVWVEIKIHRQVYLHVLGGFYNPRTSGAKLSDSIKNMERAFDTKNNMIIVGDMNEDLLNPNVHNL